MAKYICNALSLQMIDMGAGCFQFCEISKEMFETFSAGAESYVGYKEIADILDVPYNRDNLVLEEGDFLYVALFSKDRNSSKDEAKIKYYQVYVMGV